MPGTTDTNKLFTAFALATGCRSGDVYLGKQRLHLHTRPPRSPREGTDLEELFGAGYAACFLSALGEVGRRAGVDTSQAQARAEVSLYAQTQARYMLGVRLHIYIPNQTGEAAAQLIEAAHQVCPYSNATRGNIEVDLVTATALLL